MVSAARVLVSALVAFSFPLQLHPARTCATALIRGCRFSSDAAAAARRARIAVDGEPDGGGGVELSGVVGGKEAKPGGGEEDGSGEIAEELPAGRSEFWLHIGLTVGLLCGSLAVATLVGDLGVVLSVVGATGSTLVSYILPGACYTQLHPERSYERAAALVMLGSGCMIAPLALVVIFI